MITVIVSFKISTDLNAEVVKKKFLETAPMYKDVDGLIRKNYLLDIEKHTAGGAYTFETREQADKWFDQERIDWITERYSKPELTYYDTPVLVDNDKDKIKS
tara:strand:+ start:292 stop:597 length:306 start_codon:yes stop_codon:yes gene_type:complete